MVADPGCTHENQHWWWSESVFVCDACALRLDVLDPDERADVEAALALVSGEKNSPADTAASSNFQKPEEGNHA